MCPWVAHYKPLRFLKGEICVLLSIMKLTEVLMDCIVWLLWRYHSCTHFNQSGLVLRPRRANVCFYQELSKKRRSVSQLSNAVFICSVNTFLKLPCTIDWLSEHGIHMSSKSSVSPLIFTFYPLQGRKKSSCSVQTLSKCSRSKVEKKNPFCITFLLILYSPVLL